MYTLETKDNYGKQFKNQVFQNLSLEDLKKKVKLSAPLRKISGDGFSYTIINDGAGISILNDTARIASIAWPSGRVRFHDGNLTNEQKAAINAISYRFKVD